MSEFKFSCPHCGQHLSGTEAWQGQMLNCPACQKSFQVPALAAAQPALKLSAAAPAAPRPAPAAMSETAPARSGGTAFGGRASQAFVYASMGRRLVARLIDGVIMMGIIAVAGGTVGAILNYLLKIAKDKPPAFGTAVMIGTFAAIGIIGLGVPFYCLVVYPGRHSATYGKKIMGLRIIRTNGKRFGFGAAFLRALCDSVFAQFIVGIVFWIIACFDSERKTLSDLACGTRVIKV